jgi:hypothetical protein
MGRCTKKRKLESGEVESANWLMEIGAIMLLVVEGVAGNPGPPAKHDKLDQIFKEVKNQEKEKDSEITRNP